MADVVKPYPLADDLLQPVRCLAMSRARRFYASGGTAHVVASCNSRELRSKTLDDLALGQRGEGQWR